MATPLDPDAFDVLSARAVELHAAGDVIGATRLEEALFVGGLHRRLEQLARVRTFDRELRDDVVAHALLRIVTGWRRGQVTRWAMLATIVVRAAVDVARGEERAAGVAPTADDDAPRGVHGGRAFELDDRTVDHGADVAYELVDDALRIEQLAAELEQHDRPQLAAMVRAWHAGYRTGPDLAHATGITSSRIRQLKMDLRAYVRSFHADLAAYFEAGNGASESTDSGIA